ncbi:MAG: helix-turn-helix domain-containing protein [Planctomycetaceae bacterium]|nr:helix-turn-helix domain-containing protein [Planctomycetaceae bacterium]
MKPEFKRELAQFLSKQPRPFSIMAANDIIGMNVVGACRMAGLSIPNDVALVSVDNEELLCELSTPPMSSIPFDRHEIGFRAAERLDALMQGLIDYTPPLLIEPMPVVERASSILVSSGDATVNEALAYIRRNAASGIIAVDVARQASCSRRTLEARFRKELGCSILTEIHRVRVSLARHLLMETSLPINRVSTECGFNSVTRFGAIFTAMVGESPRRYRERRGTMRRDVGTGDRHGPASRSTGRQGKSGPGEKNRQYLYKKMEPPYSADTNPDRG